VKIKQLCRSSWPVHLLAALALALGVSIASLHANADIVSLREKLSALQTTFPRKVVSADLQRIVFADGATAATDDGRTKSHQEKLKDADVEDMYSQIYPIGKCASGRPPENFDPGRIRSDRVMQSLFGNSKIAASRNQVRVAWFRQELSFTQVGGANLALERVANDIKGLLRRKPGFRRFVSPSAGTFNWRNIAGTNRLSAHSFGAAIDINSKYATYWRWVGGKPGRVPRYQSKIPLEIVEIFERHGFIWGGRWYHFDTMHFEYRPDLIAIARLAEKRGCAN